MRVSLRLCALAAIVLGGTKGVQAGSLYAQTNLVSDLSTEGAAIVDPNLKNPWGVSFSATSPFWISNSGTNTTQLFSDAGGTPSQVNLTVTTPQAGTPNGGPTGQVSVPSGVSGFNLPAAGGGTVQADFIFANQNGTISAWNPGSTEGMNSAITVVNNSAGTGHADYTGLALATTANGTFLYAANTASNTIEVYNSAFQRTSLAGSFTDPNAISGYSVYNVQVLGNDLFATYGNNVGGHGTGGYVDEFDLNGNFIARIATNNTLNGGTSNNTINDPWGLALAPASFGVFGGDLLVGGLVDSEISAYNISGNTSTFEGQIAVNTGVASPFGLWSLEFGNGVTGSANTLYFTAGIDGYADGLFGAINAVPEPASIVSASLALLGGSICYGYRCLRRRKAQPTSVIESD
jgi:uncharacterized protein (TIGR03118 family)